MTFYQTCSIQIMQNGNSKTSIGDSQPYVDARAKAINPPTDKNGQIRTL